MPYHTSDTIMRIDEVPRAPRDRRERVHRGRVRARVLRVRRPVSIIGRSGLLVRNQDETVAERFTREACDRWDVDLGREVTSARATTTRASR